MHKKPLVKTQCNISLNLQVIIMKRKNAVSAVATVFAMFVLLSVLCCLPVFAEENETEILTPYTSGDVNLDSAVNVKDATTIQKYAADIITLTDIQLELADMDANGNVNVKDATYIQKLVAGLIEDSTPDEDLPQWGAPVLPPSVSATDDELPTDDDDKPIILPVIPAA